MFEPPVGGATFIFFIFFYAVDGATKNTSPDIFCRIRNFFLRIPTVFSWGAQVCTLTDNDFLEVKICCLPFAVV